MNQKKRLLIIEDDYDVAEMLVMYFGSQRYEVIHADGGGQGVELARTRFPDLILLDVMLPDMDGYEVCYRIRQNSFTKYIPVIFLTQRDERANKVRGLELGADDYITKPFDIDELRLRVQGAINRATRESLHETRTGLPTGALVEEELAQRQHSTQSYTDLRFSLDGFHAYTDVYGFMAASEVMAHAAQVMREIVSELGTPDDFVGITQDQFVIFSHTQQPVELKARLETRLNQSLSSFYSFTDVEKGGLQWKDSLQNEHFVPLMHLLWA